VPTLEDGGAALWESNAIVRYLYARYGKNPASPADPVLRARADGWTDWYATTFWSNVRPLLVQLVRTPEERRDAGLIDSSLRAASAAIQLLDRELSKKPYVAGEHFTFGDIPVGAAAQRWFTLRRCCTPGPASTRLRGASSNASAWRAVVPSEKAAGHVGARHGRAHGSADATLGRPVGAGCAFHGVPL